MKIHPALFTVFIGAAMAFLPSASAQVAPPPNDNFANRLVLTGQAVSSPPVDVTAATREGLEPAFTGLNTVWYTWTAPQDGIVTFTDQGTTYDSELAVFNGSDLSSLVLIDSQSGGSPVSVTFPSKAGFVYQIAIGSVNGIGSGTAVLNINNRPTTITAPVVIASAAGGNDNFANALALPGPTVSGFSYITEDTREGQEPAYTGNQTVWWTWTAPADATATINTAGTNFENTLTVFNGSSLSNLTVVGLNTSGSAATVSFPTKAGASYYVCVGAFIRSSRNTSVVNITTAPLTIASPVIIQSLAAANDNFANAQDLGSNPVVSGFGFNDSATTETLESPANGTNTLWWTWTAPQDGNLTVSAAHTDFDHYLNVATGDSLAALSEGAPGRGTPSAPAGGTFPVTGGTVYHFVIGSSGSAGTAVLNLNFTAGLSHVSVVAATPTVHLSQSNVATFTITRNGDLSKMLPVHFTIKGTSGLASQSYSGTKKIKAGKASANLNVSLSGTDFFKAKLKLTITAGDNYVVDTPLPVTEKVFGD